MTRGLLDDLRYALRTLRRNRAFSLVVVLTLAVAMGLNTAIFTVLYGVLLRALPYRDPGRLVAVKTNLVEAPEALTYENYRNLKQRLRAVEDLAVFYQNTGISRVTLTGIAEPQTALAGFVSANFFPLLGVPPVIGRVFTPEEEARQERVAVLSYGLWRRRFGASAAAIGATLEVNGAAFQVIGVMPREFQLPDRDTRLWAPLTTNGDWRAEPSRQGLPRWNVLGRLAPERTHDQAQSELAGIPLEMNARDGRRQFTARLETLRPPVSGNVKLALTTLSGAVFGVLLIACANIAHLMLARGVGRQRELALRSALGAGRSRLARLLLTESALLAAVSGLLGAALAAVGTEILVTVGPREIPRWEQISLDATALMFTAGLSVLTIFLAGLAPALHASRQDPNEALKSGAHAVTGDPRAGNLRRVLVAGEFALAMMLLAGAGVLIRSFLAVQSVELGFEPARAVSARVFLPAAVSADGRITYVERVLERLQNLPGAEAAGGIDDQWQLRAPGTLGFRQMEGRPPERREHWTPLTWATVSGDYFQAIGARLVAGRYFTPQDTAGSPLVALIDEAAARRYWPGENPVGQRFKGQDPRGVNDEWLTVIGVVADLRRQGLERQPTPHVFEWYRQSRVMTRDLVVRARPGVEPGGLATAVRAAIRSVDATAVIQSVNTMAFQLADQQSGRRFQTSLLSLFAGIGLALAALGIYGVMYFTVAQRTREIAVRMALGARNVQVLGMVLRQGLLLSLAGVTAGALGSWWVNRLLAGLLFNTHPFDLLTVGAVAALLLTAAVVASAVPAWRAASVDPMPVLRSE
jgi:putative ABC transport system permease protein